MESKISEIEKKTIIPKEINITVLNNNSIENIITTENIINYISSNLLSIIQNNKKMKKKPSKDPNEPLYSKMIPVLSIKKFLIRIIKYTEAENNTLIVAYLYIIKLIKIENFILSLNNIYRLLLGSVVLAKKFLEDINYNNLYYCEIGGMPVQELNNIEFSLFVRINFDVNPKIEEVNDIYKNIIYSLASSENK
jgi:hypothetical protein